MTNSTPITKKFICNTTPTRIFGLTGRFDLLVEVCGGTVRTPRQVLDPDDDPNGSADLQSEIGQAERYWSKRSPRADAPERWLKLLELRTRTDIEVIDMSLVETERYAELQSREIQHRFGLAARLGRGEAAVLSVAEERDWTAVIDEWAGREVLHAISPATPILTSRDIVRMATYQALIDSGTADGLYMDMLDLGYRGPPELWS
jgi:predicted nucleic acid-binding protein